MNVMENIIEIDSITRKFGDLIAVDNLNLSIQRNEIFGLLGPNGAGKTTTISMICGLLLPSAGTIRINNNNRADRKSFIGYCPQENIYYPKLTCLEQVVFIGQMYGLTFTAAMKKSQELLSLLGLEDKVNVMASDLSGGMKRRLNICLALVHDPEILILDEPEAGLDPQSRILVRDFIKEFGKSRTVILTTHNMDEADRMADRIAIMDHGRILAMNTPQNLKDTIGQGKMLEVVPSESDKNLLGQFVARASSESLTVIISTEGLLIKNADLISQIPVVRQIAESIGMTITEIKLRENTLEDVFINLTGRNLRQ